MIRNCDEEGKSSKSLRLQLTNVTKFQMLPKTTEYLWSMLIIPFLSLLAIHTIAHLFNVEWSVQARVEEKGTLAAVLSGLGDKPSESYVNFYRQTIEVSDIRLWRVIITFV